MTASHMGWLTITVLVTITGIPSLPRWPRPGSRSRGLGGRRGRGSSSLTAAPDRTFSRFRRYRTPAAP